MTRCDVDPERVAIWKSNKHYLKLSGAVAAVLEAEGKIKMADLQPLSRLLDPGTSG